MSPSPRDPNPSIGMGAQRGDRSSGGQRIGRRRVAKALQRWDVAARSEALPLRTIRDGLGEAPNHARPRYRIEA
jgi:hypothetical protein